MNCLVRGRKRPIVLEKACHRSDWFDIDRVREPRPKFCFLSGHIKCEQISDCGLHPGASPSAIWPSLIRAGRARLVAPGQIPWRRAVTSFLRGARLRLARTNWRVDLRLRERAAAVLL